MDDLSTDEIKYLNPYMCKGKSIKTIALDTNGSEAKARRACRDLYDDLESIVDIPNDKSLALSVVALNNLLAHVYSIEYTLHQYVNREIWFDADKLREVISSWFSTMKFVRLRQKVVAESTLSMLRKFGTEPVTRVQVRYLLLKEAALEDSVKQYFYQRKH